MVILLSVFIQECGLYCRAMLLCVSRNIDTVVVLCYHRVHVCVGGGMVFISI